MSRDINKCFDTELNDMKQQKVKFEDNINKRLSAFEEKLNSRFNAWEKQIREYKFTWGYIKENKESELNQVRDNQVIDSDSGGNDDDDLTNNDDSISANKVIDAKVSDVIKTSDNYSIIVR